MNTVRSLYIVIPLKALKSEFKIPTSLNSCILNLPFFCLYTFSVSYTSVSTSATCTPECINGGACLTDTSRQSRCSCPMNYIGSDCSEKISCTSDVECAGNKTCKVYQDQHYCDCDNDMTGFFCDLTVSPGEPAKFLISVRV